MNAATTSLTGRRILITGAARGIGAETARQAAARGARLSLIGLEGRRLAALADELGDTHWMECDVTDQQALADAVSSAADSLGGLDAVVANAGIASTGTVATGDVDAMVRTVDVNLNGVMRTTAATLPHLIESRGYLLLVSSAAAFAAMAGMAAYAASKAGVEQFGNVVRLELAHRGVAVGTAHPIWIDTELVRDIGDDLPSFHAARRRLPWPVRDIVDAPTCAAALLRAIERRRRRVYVPRTMGAVAALRTVTHSRAGEYVSYLMSGRGRLIDQMEDEVRAANRTFGRHHAGE